MEKKTVQGEKIMEELRKKRENEAFAKDKILPLLSGWKACEAVEVLYFAISEIQQKAVII